MTAAPPTAWEEFPLSFQQLQFQLILLESPTRTFDEANHFRVLEIEGAGLALEPIREALASVIRRHAPLRTIPRFDLSPPVQHVYPEHVADAVDVKVGDLRGMSRAEIGRTLAAESARPFPMDGSPLVRAAWYQTEPDSGLLIFATHHCATDLMSEGLLHREFFAAYAALERGEPAPNPPLAMTYPEYAVEQRRVFGKRSADDETARRVDRAVEFWRSLLTGGEFTLPPRDATGHEDPRPAMFVHRLDAETCTSITDACVRASISPFMLGLAAMHLALGAAASRWDVTTVAMHANRHPAATKDLIGLFSGTIFLRSRFRPDSTIEEFLADVRAHCLASFEHGNVPFLRLIEPLAAEFAAFYAVDAIPMFQNFPPAMPPTLPGRQVRTLPRDSTFFFEDDGSPAFEEPEQVPIDIHITMARERDGYLIEALHDRNAWTQETIARLVSGIEFSLRTGFSEFTRVGDLYDAVRHIVGPSSD